MHLLATVVWIGGLLYQSLFLFPALRSLPQSPLTRSLLERLRTRFQPTVWLSLAVLVGTGLMQMAANPNYAGFLAFENAWAQAILIKHFAVGLMILLAAYQSFVLFPKLTRSLLRQGSDGSSPDHPGASVERHLLLLNVMLSLIVLFLTAIARASSSGGMLLA